MPSSAIIPLALPKGAEKLCELCQREARLQCSKCRVTFYCDAEHQQADWVGIHKRICQLLVPIRTQTLHSLQQTSHIETQIKKVRIRMKHCFIDIVTSRSSLLTKVNPQQSVYCLQVFE
uniref:Zinc finger, MYND-type containing 12 n=1 Tax=Amphilophus citrinellus TaxID=61819 RepID=A0A3Q0SZV8_AMPCI